MRRRSLGDPNSNWLDDLVKDWTNETHHNVSIHGGSDKMRYYASFGYKSSDAFLNVGCKI